MNRPYLVFEITQRCNLGCLYCYNVWKQRGDYPQGELTLPDMMRLFEKLLSEVSPAGVALTGGEPLLHPAIIGISSFLAGEGIPVSVVTNGVLLDEDMAGRLTDAGVGHFEISIPGLDDDVYRGITGCDKARAARNALLMARRSGAKLTVSTVLTGLNCAETGDIVCLACAFSADGIVLNRFVPGGEGLRHLSELLPTKKELETALSAACSGSAGHGIPVIAAVPFEACLYELDRYRDISFGTCACGREKWVVDPLGNLRTCEQNPVILGSLFEKCFQELTNSLPADRFRKDNLGSGCGSCADFLRCGGGCRFLGRNR